jgi:hypothetical protein
MRDLLQRSLYEFAKEEVLTNAMAEAYKSMPDEIEKYGMPEPKWRVDYGSGDRPDEL